MSNFKVTNLASNCKDYVTGIMFYSRENVYTKLRLNTQVGTVWRSRFCDSVSEAIDQNKFVDVLETPYCTTKIFKKEAMKYLKKKKIRKRILAWMPEWLKGADCKSVGSAYIGSNPIPCTIKRRKKMKIKKLIPLAKKEKNPTWKCWRTIKKKNCTHCEDQGYKEKARFKVSYPDRFTVMYLCEECKHELQQIVYHGG